jgi:hypothetical protein
VRNTLEAPGLKNVSGTSGSKASGGGLGSKTAAGANMLPRPLMSQRILRPKLNAFLYVCQDQVSHIK